MGISAYWISAESTMRAFETNVFGALNLTRVVLAHMRPNRHGTIFFMGSIAGWFGAAGGGGYSATKFALEGWYPLFNISRTPLSRGSMVLSHR